MDALSQKHFVTVSELKLHRGSFYVNVHHPYHPNSQCGLDVTVSMQTQIKPKCKNVSLTERTICPDNLVRQSSEYHTLLFFFFFYKLWPGNWCSCLLYCLFSQRWGFGSVIWLKTSTHAVFPGNIVLKGIITPYQYLSWFNVSQNSVSTQMYWQLVEWGHLTFRHCPEKIDF